MKYMRIRTIVISVLFVFLGFSFSPAVRMAWGSPADTLYKEGKKFYDAKDYSSALDRLTRAAELGHVDAQTDLGAMYTYGLGVGKDERQALQWLHKAAEQGNADAQYLLGVIYNSRGTAEDEQQAVQWYRKAAEQGHETARRNLAEITRRQGGRQTGPQAGRQAAVVNVETLYKEGMDFYNAKNYSSAFDRFRKAAEQGYVYAQSNLGYMYNNGEGVTKDERQAAQWYLKAAEQGHATSQNSLGLMYFAGRGVTKDERQAAQWLLKAAEQGHAAAQSNLGYMYNNGLGVTKDERQAAQWYLKAAEQGHAGARAELKKIEEKMGKINSNKAEEGSKQPTSPIAAKTLLTEIKQNQMRFDRNYKDKTITVAGFVGKIDEKDRGYILEFFGETGFVDPFSHIECRFDKSQEDALLDLNRDDAVNVRGTYRGEQPFELGRLTLFDCEIVK